MQEAWKEQERQEEYACTTASEQLCAQLHQRARKVGDNNGMEIKETQTILPKPQKIQA
jgi:hypothetical protein